MLNYSHGANMENFTWWPPIRSCKGSNYAGHSECVLKWRCMNLYKQECVQSMHLWVCEVGSCIRSVCELENYAQVEVCRGLVCTGGVVGGYQVKPRRVVPLAITSRSTPLQKPHPQISLLYTSLLYFHFMHHLLM